MATIRKVSQDRLVSLGLDDFVSSGNHAYRSDRDEEFLSGVLQEC